MTRKLIDLKSTTLLWLKQKAERERTNVKALIESLLDEAAQQEHLQRLERVRKLAGAWDNPVGEELIQLIEKGREDWSERAVDL